MRDRPTGDAALLLLADSRLPAGGHAHSGGAEEAVRLGTITGPEDLARFLRGRLATAGLVSAALAAAACEFAAATADHPAGPYGHAGPDPNAADLNATPNPGRAPAPAPAQDTEPAQNTNPASALDADPASAPDTDPEPATDPARLWRRLDAEADARTASPAQREASRVQGRLLIRSARRIWPSAVLDELARAVPEGAHHPVALGAAAAAAGCDPYQAALAAAYNSVTGPATAAVRLLGLDPVTVHRLLADLAPALNDAAHAACASLIDDVVPTGGSGWPALPGHTAPALDLLAEGHLDNPMKLFVS
ncbi:hypothetical protein GCM10023194_16180 [Planotetraspora phitsanulokensis]|uniref:Urease accessory protein UreF n=1 Tax=Planotetraspora phitsanulokensis TaxID=575192 RepID=A0A8J3U5V1_9ACTN|nr:urease accessory UreF family protein [Planotetraspora phitsanulokensis]GII38770.1 hypothetical protein Pph01_37730 [Planotetraspora phitsanulokensis]